jgi:hypothetical protein
MQYRFARASNIEERPVHLAADAGDRHQGYRFPAKSL